MAYTKLTYGDEIEVAASYFIVDSDNDINNDFFLKYGNTAPGSIIKSINNGEIHYWICNRYGYWYLIGSNGTVRPDLPT